MKLQFAALFSAVIWMLFALSSCAQHHSTEKPLVEGFFPVKGLKSFLRPFLTQDLEAAVASPYASKIGQGAWGSVHWLPWPGQKNGAIVKINRLKKASLNEATFLAYLDGAGGAPKLLAFDLATGVLVSEFLVATEMKDLIGVGLSREQWLLLYMSLTWRLSELHHLGVVHADLKPNNVMVTFAQDGYPTAHIIDFGLSTLSGLRSGNLLKYKNLQRQLNKRRWIAAEFFQGQTLDTRADSVGLAYSMTATMPDMQRHCGRLFRLTQRAKAHRREERPSLQEFMDVLLYEYGRLTE